MNSALGGATQTVNAKKHICSPDPTMVFIFCRGHTSLFFRLSPRTILGIDTSFKMMCPNWFLCHRMEQKRENFKKKKRKEGSPWYIRFIHGLLRINPNDFWQFSDSCAQPVELSTYTSHQPSRWRCCCDHADVIIWLKGALLSAHQSDNLHLKC